MKFKMIVLAILMCVSNVAMALPKAEVEAKIKTMQEQLESHLQGGLATWKGSHDGNHAGASALVTEALIVSGYPASHPVIQASVAWQIGNKPESVYSSAMRSHMWSYLPLQFNPQLREETYVLWASRNDSGAAWGKYDLAEPYEIGTSAEQEQGGRGDRIDNSMNQYGVLSMWQASKRGIEVPHEFWDMAINHILGLQHDSGAWSYGASSEPTIKMTCAGLTVLYVSRMERDRHLDIKDPVVEAAIQKGLAWLDANYSTNVNGHHASDWGYQYYGFERVGLASGVRYFGGVDWYESMGRVILDNSTTDIVDKSFRLKFLARGGKPVWCQKLEINSYDWSNRPNDIYFMTQNLQYYRELEIDWQVSNLTLMPLSEMMRVPITYMSLRKNIELSEDQLAKLRKYIDLGGLLWLNPESGSEGSSAASDLCRKLYPELSLTDVESDDILSMGFEYAAPAEVLNNGSRHLVVVNKQDFGMELQKDKTFTIAEDHFRLAVNIYRLGTNQGNNIDRTDTFKSFDVNTVADGSITVAMAKPAGMTGAEPEAWTLQNKYMKGLGASGVSVIHGGFEVVNDTVDLIHVTGVNALSKNELDILTTYIKNGGTVLLESQGGRNNFSSLACEQLSLTTGGMYSIIDEFSPIFTGRELGLSGKAAEEADCVVPSWRQVVIERSPVKQTSHSLNGVTVDGRLAVISSDYDLSLGAMECTQYGIVGYGMDTAKSLMMNIATYAKNN